MSISERDMITVSCKRREDYSYMVSLEHLITENRNPETMDLDSMTPMEIVTVMNREDERVVNAVKEVLPDVARLIEICTKRLEEGGRMIYIGAGTSGRIGVLDAVECPPTFGVSDQVVMGLIAGGEGAFVKAVEGAEDDGLLAEKELKEKKLSPRDIVIGLAASGRTPYVVGGLNYAKKVGCVTASIACNHNSVISKEADYPIEVETGPEILTGSTRLKAGTAQKMILNMVSTATMVGIGKVYENLMVDLVRTNEKLEARLCNIVMEAAGCDRARAVQALSEAEGNGKVAIIMILSECGRLKAEEKLKEARGHVRRAVMQT